MSASTDISKFLAGLGKAKERGRAAARRALDRFGEHVLGDAQQLTPVKTGFLQNSATAEPAQDLGGKLTKEIGFNASYAAPVHERLDVHHAIGQAKFLSTAVERNAPKLADYVVNEVKKAL